MTQPVHLRKAGTQGVALVDPELLHVVAVARDQGAEACQPACAIQHLALGLGADGNGSFPTALGPARLEHQVIPAVGKAWLEFDRLFPAQTEGLLQFQAHFDVLIPDFVQL